MSVIAGYQYYINISIAIDINTNKYLSLRFPTLPSLFKVLYIKSERKKGYKTYV